MAGLTDEGLSRPIQAEIVEEIAADMRGTISALLEISESTVAGNLANIFADQIEQVWEVVEEAVDGLDPERATDSRLVALCLLTGVARRGPQKGLVTATLNLAAAKTFAPGDLTAHVVNEPSNRWTNRDAVVSTSSGNYSAVFESEDTGSTFSAPSGSLTVIATPVTGWNSVTNSSDATPGSDIESIEDLRLRREQSLSRAGSGTVDAIEADVGVLDGVLQVLVEENTTDAIVGSLTPHSLRVVVWDGDPGAADDDDIAQAIHDTRPAGIAVVGSLSGTAVKADGSTTTVAFDRAEAVDIYVDVEIVSAAGVAIVDVREAILAAMPEDVGSDVIYNRLAAAAFNVEGVDDVTFTQIGVAPSPSGTANISISATQIALLSSEDIIVTGDAT